jgi:hypothetical protein
VTPQILKWGVVEGMVSGLLRSKGEGREPRTPSFQTRLTPLLDLGIDENHDLKNAKKRHTFINIAKSTVKIRHQNTTFLLTGQLINKNCVLNSVFMTVW